MVRIWRNDDISPNSNFELTKNLYKILKEYHPQATIWSCVNIFARQNELGSIYKEVPFRNKPIDWFYNVNMILSLEWVEKYREISEIVSHGLFHINHAQVSKDAQKMSILSSCLMLKTKIFVPPFNAWNQYTKEICDENGIHLVTSRENWKSIDVHDFHDDQEIWYFHSWRHTPCSIRNIIEKSKCLKTLNV